MKDLMSQNRAPSVTRQLRSIRFCFTHPTAVSVSVAGSFNDWHPGSRSMHPAKNGDWMKVLILPVGIYEYCLVVDGSWIPDPLAVANVCNPFVGKNSILQVEPSPDALTPDVY